MSKTNKIVSICVYIIAVIVIIVSILALYYFTASYPEFTKTSQVEVAIPGLDDGFVPQGMAYADNSEGYLMTGYMDDSAMKSRLYFVPDAEDKVAHYVTISGASNEKLESGHLGGVATVGDSVWLATEGVVLRVSLETVLSTENGIDVPVIDEFMVSNEASFAYASNDKLFVGEYYKEGKFDTDVEHKISTSDGYNYAITAMFTIDEREENGVVSTDPELVISLPPQVQGFAYDGSQIILSTSYGVADSQLHVYNVDLTAQTSNVFFSNGESIPMYILSSDNLEKSISAPAMSEGIDFVDGRLSVLFESACNKYKFVNRTRTADVLSILIG